MRERFGLPEQLPPVGRAACASPIRASGSRHWRARARTMPLVLVGPAGRWASELPASMLTGAVDDDELAAIYTGAHALVFPSDDEGFGLPPVEALACGTPVAACDVPALREVLDGLGRAQRSRRPRRARARRRVAAPAGAGAARVDLARRGPRDLRRYSDAIASVRAGARRHPAAAALRYGGDRAMQRAEPAPRALSPR